MKRDTRIDRIEELITPVVEREGLELVGIELKREAIGLVLRIYLDTKEGGISLDTLTAASQKFNRILDESDIIAQEYTLEVSSPGIERPLTKPEHFIRFKGSDVVVKTDKPIKKRKQFKGKLVDAGDNNFVIEVEDGERYEIEYDNVAKARLQVKIEF